MAGRWQRISRQRAYAYVTRAGVFSADALDAATALVAGTDGGMLATPQQRILDMACGSGHLGIYALHLNGQRSQA